MPIESSRTRVTCHLGVLMLSAAIVACGGGSAGVDGTGAAPPPSPTPTPTPPPPPPPSSGTAMLGSCPAFPANAVFNTRIDGLPAHASSSAWIAAIGSTRALHADWGSNDNPAASDYYGIPTNLLAASNPQTDWPAISFTADGAPDESDCAIANGSGGHDLIRDCTSRPAASLRFPMPRDAVIALEGGTCNDPDTCGDRHVLVVEQGACRLWESFYTYKVAGQWSAYSTAAWDLNSNAMRPAGWTSGDAAGLPIAPLLARASEASTGEIAHALRVTFRDAVLANTYAWPARHRAGNSAGSIPFGALLRLKASFAIPANWTPQAKALATAMQRYGLYVADIGSDLYVQGDPSAAWSSSTVPQIQTLRMSDFEFVELGRITGDSRFDGNSYAASW